MITRERLAELKGLISGALADNELLELLDTYLQHRESCCVRPAHLLGVPIERWPKAALKPQEEALKAQLDGEIRVSQKRLCDLSAALQRAKGAEEALDQAVREKHEFRDYMRDAKERARLTGLENERLNENLRARTEDFSKERKRAKEMEASRDHWRAVVQGLQGNDLHELRAQNTRITALYNEALEKRDFWHKEACKAQASITQIREALGSPRNQ